MAVKGPVSSLDKIWNNATYESTEGLKDLGMGYLGWFYFVLSWRNNGSTVKHLTIIVLNYVEDSLMEERLKNFVYI